MPGLEDQEYTRERDFYADRGLPCPKVGISVYCLLITGVCRIGCKFLAQDLEAESEKDEKLKREEEVYFKVENLSVLNFNMQGAGSGEAGELIQL